MAFEGDMGLCLGVLWVISCIYVETSPWFNKTPIFEPSLGEKKTLRIFSQALNFIISSVRLRSLHKKKVRFFYNGI